MARSCSGSAYLISNDFVSPGSPNGGGPGEFAAVEGGAVTETAGVGLAANLAAGVAETAGAALAGLAITCAEAGKNNKIHKVAVQISFSKSSVP